MSTHCREDQMMGLWLTLVPSENEMAYSGHEPDARGLVIVQADVPIVTRVPGWIHAL